MTAFEIYKAQAQVLVPLVRELVAELGEARARALVTKALGEHFRAWGRELMRSRPEPDFGDRIHAAMDMFAEGDALDWEIREKDADGLRFDVTRCRYAELYEALGAPELGFLLVCSQDFAITEGFGEDARLERTKTLMQGHDRCDFHWYRERRRSRGRGGGEEPS